MPIILPTLPDPDLDETGPYCVIAKHRAKPGLADAYERRMLAGLEETRAEPGAFQFHIHRDRFDRDLFVIYEVWRDANSLREHFEKPFVKQFVTDSVQYIEGNMEVQWLVMTSKYLPGGTSMGSIDHPRNEQNHELTRKQTLNAMVKQDDNADSRFAEHVDKPASKTAKDSENQGASGS